MVSEIHGRLFVIIILAFMTGFFVLFAAQHAMSALTQKEPSRLVVIRDEFDAGAHRLSGTVIIPSVCDLLTIKAEERGTHQYHLYFETWREPYRDCPKGPVARWFKTTVFAPEEDTKFTGELDEEQLYFVVIPAIDLSEELNANAQ